MDLQNFLIDLAIIFKIVGILIYSYTLRLISLICMPFQEAKNTVKGKTVLITGAGGGIGSNLVRRMSHLGCNIICVDSNPSGLDRLKEELKGQSNRIKYYTIDITSSENIAKLGQEVRSEFEKVDIIINNAGTMNKGKLLVDTSEKEIRSLFDVNVFAHFIICKEFLPDMINNNEGHIVNVASVCGFLGSYKLVDYCSSKFAVMGMTESLRIELKVLNPNNKIKVATVCPFHVKTKLFNGVEFSRLKWLSLSMEPEYVADQIVDGILKGKELIPIPNVTTHILWAIKNMISSEVSDSAMINLDLSASIDKYKEKK